MTYFGYFRELVEEMHPTSVDEYRYNSKKVYLFEDRNVYDGYQSLFTRNGECMALYGGFSGKGDGRCLDFWDNSEWLRTVYADGEWVK